MAVEELLRWVSPVKNMSRTVTTDVELRGQRLREGDEVMLFYPSANRDEDVFERADEFDIRRDPNPHLAFGFGPHFCLGASLARLELKVMFREVLRPDARPRAGSRRRPARPAVELRERPRGHAGALHPDATRRAA